MRLGEKRKKLRGDEENRVVIFISILCFPKKKRKDYEETNINMKIENKRIIAV